MSQAPDAMGAAPRRLFVMGGHGHRTSDGRIFLVHDSEQLPSFRERIGAAPCEALYVQAPSATQDAYFEVESMVFLRDNDIVVTDSMLRSLRAQRASGAVSSGAAVANPNHTRSGSPPPSRPNPSCKSPTTESQGGGAAAPAVARSVSASGAAGAGGNPAEGRSGGMDHPKAPATSASSELIAAERLRMEQVLLMDAERHAAWRSQPPTASFVPMGRPSTAAEAAARRGAMREAAPSGLAAATRGEPREVAPWQLLEAASGFTMTSRLSLDDEPVEMIEDLAEAEAHEALAAMREMGLAAEKAMGWPSAGSSSSLGHRGGVGDVPRAAHFDDFDDFGQDGGEIEAVAAAWAAASKNGQ